MTVDELAKELGISPKTLRAWLRDRHERPTEKKGSKWVLSTAVVYAARSHFS